MKGKREPVRLREKELANGQRSLYLDIYINGRRKYEFLKLYLIPETNREAKQENRRTMELAEAVKAKRIVELQNNRFGFETEYESVDFIKYVEEKAKTVNVSERTRKSYNMMIVRLRKYFDGKLKASELGDAKTVQGFYNYIVSDLRKTSSANHVFGKFEKFVNLAIKEGVLKDKRAIAQVDKVKSSTSERKYLTIDELKTLAETMNDNITRMAFFFSCLTGLRISDVRALDISMVSKAEGRTRITFSQKKTKGLQYLDISEDASMILDKAVAKKGAKPFRELIHAKTINKKIEDWMNEIGISKHITFHCARHTFAVMMIELGVDIYTISKLLGHSDINTTQIYAKMVDKRKREAVDLIPRML